MSASENSPVQLPPLDVSRQDDPQVLKDAAVDDFAGHVVPDTWRSSRPSLSMAWLAVFSAMFWLVFPGTLSLLVGTRDTTIGMLLAAGVIALAGGILSRYAARSGVSLAQFSRRLLGFWGGAFASLVVGVTAIYYCSFEASVIALAFHEYFSRPPISVWYLLSAIFGVAMAIGGVRVWLDKFNGWLLPVYCLGLAAAVIWSITRYGYDPAWLSYQPEGAAAVAGPGWILAFSGYLSQLVLVMYLWDFARMSRKHDATFHARTTFGLPFWLATFVLNGLIGMFLAHTIELDGPLSDTSAVLGLVALMGIFGVLLVWVTQSRINTANFYVSSLNLQSFGGRILRLALPRTIWVVIVGAIVFALMLSDVLSFLLAALNYQGVFVASWVTIACVHLLLGKHRNMDSDWDEFRPGRLPPINYAGLGSWLASALVGLLLLVFGGAAGPTWALPIVIVLSASLYPLFSRVQTSHRAVLSRPHDPRDEVADAWQDRIRCAECDKSYLAVEMDRNPANGHSPICALCAERSRTFYQAARLEAGHGHVGVS